MRKLIHEGVLGGVIDADTGVKYYSTALANVAPDGIETHPLMQWAKGTDFFTAPASTKYHGAEKHGLLKHSIAVCEALYIFFDVAYNREVPSKDWVYEGAVAALFHDACKAGLYKEVTKWRKDENGRWESYPGWEVDPDKIQIGHGVESLRIIERHYSFKYEGWKQAVAWHMSPPTDYVERQMHYKAMEKHPEVCFLQWADQYATFIEGL